MIESESQLVGLAIQEPSVIDDAGDITPQHFASKPHGLLWGVLTSLRDAGLESRGAIPIVREAKRQGVYEAIGGAATIAKLSHDAGLTSLVPMHVADIKAAFDRKRLKAALTKALRDLDDDAGDVAAIRSQVDAALHVDSAESTGAESLDEIVSDLIDSMGRHETKTPPVKTGLDTFDETTGGLFSGELIIVAARPSVGKSALASTIGLNAAATGSRVLFVSLEMTGRDIAARMIAGESGVKFSDIRMGTANADRLRRSQAAFQDLPFRVWSGRNLTIDRLKAICRLEQARGGVDLLIVDYIGLIAPSDRRKPRWESVTEVSNNLKSLALSMAVPVIALCQLNRDAEGETPKLSHLRESGAIEQDADVVALLHRNRDSTEATLNVAKIRNGRAGTISLHFDGPATRFSEPSTSSHANYEPAFNEYSREA